MTTPWMKTKEAAAYSRYSLDTIYRAIDSGDLQYSRDGQRCAYRIHKDWLDQWLKGRAA